MEKERNIELDLSNPSNFESKSVEVSESTGFPERAIQSSSPLVSKFGFTRRQFLIFTLFGIIQLLAAIVISLQAPFYPQEAESKGASATQYGFVFGIFEIIVFISSPIYGKYMNILGPKHVFNVGIFVTSTSSILFGFLDRINDGNLFIALSLLTRVVEALGSAAFVTASFTIIALEFHDSVGKTIASMEMFYGLGLVVGPTLGGALFQLGGFTVPFVSIGVSLLVAASITAIVMPKTSILAQSKEEEEEAKKFGFLKMISISAVSLSAFTIVSGAISIGFNSAILEPHIRQFGLVPVTSGIVLIISGAHYAVSTPLWGILCDKSKSTLVISLIGTILIMGGYSLMGPLPIIPIQTTLWMTCVGLAIQGLGLGATLVAAFLQALKFSLNRGFPDNVQTNGLVSGIWTSSFALGCFIGPSVAGILFDTVGYRMGTYFVIALQFLNGLLTFTFITIMRNNRCQ